MVNSDNLQQVQHIVHFWWKKPAVWFDFFFFYIYELLFCPKVIQTSQENGISHQSYLEKLPSNQAAVWNLHLSRSATCVFFSLQMLWGSLGHRGHRMRQQPESEDTFLSWPHRPSKARRLCMTGGVMDLWTVCVCVCVEWPWVSMWIFVYVPVCVCLSVWVITPAAVK